MRNLKSMVWAIATAATIAAAPVRADDNKAETAAVIGALVAIGAAALLHHEDHHYDSKHYDDTDRETLFERGYRDGLHNDDYDPRYNSEAYGEGFSAGMKERENRLAHKRRHESDGPNAPTLAMRACVGEASARWNRNPRDIHVVKSRQAASNDFFVEVSAGHKHGNCEVSATGDIYLFQNGRI
jgi:hypothetical protein